MLLLLSMKKQNPTIMAHLFNYIRIIIIILFILITGDPDNMAAQGQTSDIGEGHGISSQKSDGIYIPINTAFTDVKRAGLKMPSPDHRIIHSRDGRIIASASKVEPEYITIWNTVTWTSLDIHPAELIKAWGLFPDGKILATGSDKNITLWDTTTGSVLKVLKGVILSDSFSFSPDGKILATVNNKKVVLKDVDTGNIIRELKLKGVPAKMFDVEGAKKAGYSDSEIAQYLSNIHGFDYNGATSAGYNPSEIIGYLSNEDIETKLSISFSIDGRMLAILEWDTKTLDRLVTLWDTATWKKIEFKNINDVVFSPDGRFFGIIKRLEGKGLVYSFFNAQTWSKVTTITALDISFSVDGKVLAATDGDSVTLWDTATWHRLRTFATNNCDTISSIFFSPDNRTIVTGYNDNFIALWDSMSGNRIKILAPEYDGRIDNIFFSPDGRKLFTNSDEPVPPPPPPPDDLGLGRRECLPLESSLKSEMSLPPKKKYSEDPEPNKVWALPDFYVTEQFKKDEFESVREFSDRVKRLEVPFSYPVNLRGYDAEKLRFSAELDGTEIFIPTPKEKARELALNKEDVLVTGSLRYFNSEKLELVNAALTSVAPQSPAYTYKTPGTYATATAPVENIADSVHKLNIRDAKEHKDYFAVVIGIERYRDIKSDAMYAVKDAEWVREYLIKGVGIPKANIRTLINENATKGDIEKTVEVWLRNKVKGSNSMVFFYYSGHGAPDVNGDTEAYIVPYDGDPDYLEKTAYPLKSLYASLSQLPSNNVIAVLDSCFAGRGDRSVLASGVKPIVLEVKNPYTAMGNTVVLAAAEPKEVSSAYSDAGHGLFTYYLLRGLNGEADTNGDGWVELNELFTYTDTKVIETAGEMNREQHPVISPRIEDLGERGKMRLTKVK